MSVMAVERAGDEGRRWLLGWFFVPLLPLWFLLPTGCLILLRACPRYPRRWTAITATIQSLDLLGF